MDRKIYPCYLGEIIVASDSSSVEKQLVQQSYDSVELFITVLDPEGKILLINRRGRELMGYESEEITGRKFIDEFIEKSKQTKTRKLFDGIVKGKLTPSVNRRYFLKTGKGKNLILEAKCKIIYGNANRVTGIILSGKNMTSHLVRERSLQDAVTQRKETISSLRQSAKDAEEAKTATIDFLARVSHEIRTPLSAIIGFTEQLSQTSLDHKQEEYVKIINESSEHLMVLIDDILAMSKIEAGEIHFTETPFKIIHIIEHLYNSFTFKANEKNLGFSYYLDEKLDLVLIGDPFRLQQILINLLNNAIKFTDEGYVELRCVMEKESSARVKVRFEVTDTGIGISKSNQKQIFKPFIQADNFNSKEPGGTGLGLTICKNLIEMQNGSLSVFSSEKAGTTFYFVLPYKKGKETDRLYSGKEMIDQKTLKDKKVLLADDDNFNRLLGKTILSKFGCTFDVVKDGKEAKALLDSTNYDIVLLDMHMPGLNGTKVARYIRDQKPERPEKIIAVTAAVLKREIIDYYNAGVNDFLVKPFRETDLFRKICHVLQVGDNLYEPTRAELVLKEELIRGAYDLTELKKITDGNEELVKKMLSVFIENTENAITRFEQLTESKNWKEIGETAHKLLPSYRHLNAESLVSDLVELKNKTLIRPEFGTLPGLLKQTIDGMRMLVHKLKDEN